MTLNLLPIAMRATAILGCNKNFLFYKWIKNTVDAMGRDVPEYAPPVPATGSIQAVSNKMYEQLGLDLDKHYKIVFSPVLIQSIAEKIQPDRILYNGRTYEVAENKNWYETNGYTKVLMAELKELRVNEGNPNTLQDQKSDIQ